MSHTFTICPSCRSLNKVSIEKALASKAICGKCQKNLDLHGLVTNVTTAEFRKILRVSDRPVVVDFWASWCGPCQMYGPEFEKASLKSPEVVFLKVNTETEQDLSRELGIKGIPLTILFNQGKEVARQSGAMEAAGVMSFLQIKKS